jgi:hypothetical protein
MVIRSTKWHVSKVQITQALKGFLLHLLLPFTKFLKFSGAVFFLEDLLCNLLEQKVSYLFWIYI